VNFFLRLSLLIAAMRASCSPLNSDEVPPPPVEIGPRLRQRAAAAISPIFARMARAREYDRVSRAFFRVGYLPNGCTESLRDSRDGFLWSWA
jgi:hypothetical protein